MPRVAVTTGGWLRTALLAASWNHFVTGALNMPGAKGDSYCAGSDDVAMTSRFLPHHTQVGDVSANHNA